MTNPALETSFIEPEKGIAQTLAQDFTAAELRAEILEYARESLYRSEDVVLGQYERDKAESKSLTKDDLINVVLGYEMEMRERRELERKVRRLESGEDDGSEGSGFLPGVFGNLF